MSKVAVAMIVKGDESKRLDRCLASLHQYVDGIFVTVTTPDEGVKDIVDKYKGHCFIEPYKFHRVIDKKVVNWLKEYGIDPKLQEKDKIFEFDKARNFSFEQVPEEYEYIIWIDVDDVAGEFVGMDCSSSEESDNEEQIDPNDIIDFICGGMDI